MFQDQDDTENRPSRTFVKKFVADITPNDSSVQLTGYASNINKSNEFVLDDTTGKIALREIPDEFPQVQEKQVYRVCGDLSIDGTGTQYIAVKAIGQLNGLDFNLHKKIEQLRKKIT